MIRQIERSWPCGFPGWFETLDTSLQADLLGEHFAFDGG